MRDEAMTEPGGFDFDAAVTAPFRMQPGLRRLAADAPPALTALAPGSAAFHEKLAVLRTAPGEALLGVDGFDAAAALAGLAEEAARVVPKAIATRPGKVAAPALGWRVGLADGRLEALHRGADPSVGDTLAALPPAQRLAGLFALALHEDLALIDGRSATLPWLAVCLPSHWVPRDKLGRHFAAVHAPVADNATLLAASEPLIRLVCQPQRWERFVWTLTTHPGYDQHPARHQRRPWPQDIEAAAAMAWWRTERQSFIPLPGLQQAVFTIHVDVQPLAAAIATPCRAGALHASLASMSEAVLDYRGLRDARAPLLAWLARRAAA